MADLLHAVPNFTARATGQGHEKPFWYYARLLGGGWSGAAIGVWPLWALFARSVRPGTFFWQRTPAGFCDLQCNPLQNSMARAELLAANHHSHRHRYRMVVACLAKFSARALILVFIAAMGYLIAHDTRERVFQIPADEKNPYAYAHTGEDLLRLAPRLAELARQDNLSDPRIAVVAADAWPLPWYLRKLSQVGFWQRDRKPAGRFFHHHDGCV